jgi:hypothetical protein
MMSTSEQRRARRSVEPWQPRPVPPAESAYPGLRARLLAFYVVLTAVAALVVVFLAVRLVAGSTGERFNNRLHEASRVAADGVARLERHHLEQLRVMAQTAGVADAVAGRDAQALQTLLAPLAIEADT